MVPWLAAAGWAQDQGWLADLPTAFEADWVIYAADDRVDLRKAPDAKARVVAQLALGSKVTVTGVADPTEIKGRSDRWYAVTAGGQQGFVWGASLTASRFEADFDGDGQVEIATVAHGPDHQVIVRMAKTNGPLAVGDAGRGSSRIEQLDSVGPGTAQLRVVQRGEAGSLNTQVWYHQGKLASLQWEERQTESSWQWVTVTHPTPLSMHRVSRSGQRAEDGTGSEAVDVSDLAFRDGAWVATGVPARHVRQLGPPVDTPLPTVALTPENPTHVASLDLDGDGVEERTEFALVEHAVVVRVDSGEGRFTHLFEPFHQTFSSDFLDRADVGLSTAAGVPLLIVRDPGEEMCGSTTRTTWLSYQSGKLQVAFEKSDWADAPYFSYDEVAFDALNRSVELVHHQGYDAHDTVTRTHLMFREGVYVAADP